LASTPGAQQEGASPPPDKKQLEAQAKELVAQGKALEQQGRLPEAKDKYLDAEGVFSTREALGGLKRIHDAREEKIGSLLTQARDSFEVGKFSDRAQQLEGVEFKIIPGQPVPLRFREKL